MLSIRKYECVICGHHYDNAVLAQLCESNYIKNIIKQFPNPIDKNGTIKFNTRYDGFQIDKVIKIYTYSNTNFQRRLDFIYSKNYDIIEIINIIEKEALKFKTLHELYYEVENNHELTKDNLTNMIGYDSIIIPNLYIQQIL